MNGEGRPTTITVSRATKSRFLEEVIGAPKKFKNADLALIALLDNWGNKDKSVKEEAVDGVHSS